MASDSFCAMLNILIRRYGVDMGILEWDAQAGSFAGFNADAVRTCAEYPQYHPAFPPYDKPAKHDPVGLAILLVCLGWDVPDALREPITAWLADQPAAPEGAVF